jgi:protocatechuate 3,4-dioxygenase beta subunit
MALATSRSQAGAGGRIAALTAVIAVLAALVLSLLGAPAAAQDPQRPGSLSGSVTDPDGRPVPGTVRLFPADTTTDSWGPPVLEAPVGVDGTWRIPVSTDAEALPPGGYLIRAKPDGDYQPRWYRMPAPSATTPEDATPVAAAAALDRADLDIVVPPYEVQPPQPQGELSGRVTDARGVPVPQAVVALLTRASAGDPAAQPAATATTDAAGMWRIPTASIPDGSFLLRVTADPARFTARWFPDSPDAASAEPIQVGPDTIRAGLDVVLPDAVTTGGISGQVIANRRMVPEAVVTVIGPDGPVQSARTDEQGNYRFTELPAGEYRIRATAQQYSLPPRWYPDERRQRDSQPLSVAAGATVVDRDIDMSFQPVHPGGRSVRAQGPKLPAAARTAPMDVFTRYQGQRRCIPRPQPGAVALYSLLRNTYGNITIGLNRACLRVTSEHYDGRALDWMVSIRDKSQARKGDQFTKWLTMTRGLEVGAMARRLGVMYVIWRDRIWKQYQADKGWQKYYDCGSRKKQRWFYDRPCHRDHVHISMNWPGARKNTSWWRAVD